MKKKLRILITGSNGFVGKNLKYYLKSKKNLKVFVDNKKKYNLSKNEKFKKLILFSKPDIIIHLASRTVSGIKSPRENKLQYENTFRPVKNLLANTKYSKNLRKIIFTGSIEEYGRARTPFRENRKAKPISSYGKFKLKSLKYIMKKLKNKKISYIWLRPCLMFGPNDNKRRFLGSILNGAKNKEVINIFLGQQVRDYMYINDFNKFIYNQLIYKNFLENIILNVTNENWISLNWLLRRLNFITKGKVEKYFKIIKDEDQSKLINSGKLLRKKFPKFKFTNFQIALRDTIKDYKI